MNSLPSNIPDENVLDKRRSDLNDVFYKRSRGQINFNRETGKALVSLFESSDRSTFIHEMGHLMLEDLIRFGLNEAQESGIKQDVVTALDFLGILDMDLSDIRNMREEDKPRYREAHEKWAAAFEAYIMEGRSPLIYSKENNLL
ncbi:MAG: hypothetical protein Q4F74_02505 [Synergistaceae bacterium]|nr:hypothetical protein [Synergistaceae bacterium]